MAEEIEIFIRDECKNHINNYPNDFIDGMQTMYRHLSPQLKEKEDRIEAQRLKIIELQNDEYSNSKILAQEKRIAELEKDVKELKRERKVILADMQILIDKL